jgi:exodeoxyribonuclease V beta subunit
VRPLDQATLPLGGNHLIEASAGTGKTHTIASLYVRLLLERGLGVNEILVVTYTTAATAELRGRIRERLREAAARLASGSDEPCGDETLDRLYCDRATRGQLALDRQRLLLALYSFDEAAIFTIHGFCERVLMDHVLLTGAAFDPKVTADPSALIEEHVYDFWAKHLFHASELFLSYAVLGKDKQQLTPNNLVELSRVVLTKQPVELLPQTAQQSIEPLTEAWRQARERAFAQWNAFRGQILERLCDTKNLNKTTYKPESIRNLWAPDIDRVFRREAPKIESDFAESKSLTPTGLCKATKKAGLTPTHPFFEAWSDFLDADGALVRELEQRRIALNIALASGLREQLDRQKRRSGLLCFDDLIHRVYDALQGRGGEALAADIRGRHKAALIDEFQDTDRLQYQIFSRIYAGADTALFLIGDPKQAIYAFRGADIFAYLDAKKDSGENSYTLGVNWRSDPALIAAVNGLFGAAQRPFVVENIDFQPMAPAPRRREPLRGALAERAPLLIQFVPRQKEWLDKNTGATTKEWARRHVPRAVAAEISRLLRSKSTIGQRPVGPGDIAVLCRTRQQVTDVQAALRVLGVPSVRHGAASVFDSDEALELERVLRAWQNPGDAEGVATALATRLIGLRACHLQELQRDEREWEKWLRRFWQCQQSWMTRGFAPTFRLFVEQSGCIPKLLAQTDGERYLTNILHLQELIQKIAAERGFGPLGVIHWLSTMRQDASARDEQEDANENAEMRLESDADAVQLVTIHSAKGLEYSIVFCPYLWDGRLSDRNDKRFVVFHDPEQDYAAKLDFFSEGRSQEYNEHSALAKREAMAESTRLLYVALTRAKYHCCVLWGAFNGWDTSALGYLLHQSRDGGPSSDLVGDTQARIKKLDDTQMLADLHALAGETGGAIGISEIDRVSRLDYVAPTSSARELKARVMERRIDRRWRISSFTALTRPSADADSGADQDDRFHKERFRIKEAVSDPSRQPIPLCDFPAGATAGTLIHKLLERLDFERSTPEEVSAEAQRVLTSYGFDSVWTEPLSRAMQGVLDTFVSKDLTLRMVPRSRRLDELEFMLTASGFPTSSGRSEPTAPIPFTSARLAEVLSLHSRGSMSSQYLERVSQLAFEPLTGFLRGFIDLVFEHNGRFYLVDYKSNLLGRDPDDYQAAELTSAMEQHHYFLQYHFYLVALDRYFRQRLPGYNYERDFGGVFYLFIRGMSPSFTPGNGVFHDRPAGALIEGLSELFSISSKGA